MEVKVPAKWRTS